MLEEIGEPYETIRLDLAVGDQRRPEFLAVTDRGRVPALYEDGWVLTESAAILRHLARSHPEAALWPRDGRKQAIADEWLSWLTTNHHVAHVHFTRPERFCADDEAIEAVRARGADTYGDLCTMTEVYLSSGGWALGGAYSVVDPYLFVLWNWARGPLLGFDVAIRFPAWTAHARSLATRPAVRRVLVREGISPPV